LVSTYTEKLFVFHGGKWNYLCFNKYGDKIKAECSSDLQVQESRQLLPFQLSLHGGWKSVADLDQSFGWGSQIRGRQKVFTCFNTPAALWQSLGITRKCQETGYFLVELRNLSGNHYILKLQYVINSQEVWNGSKKIGPIFHKLHVTENAVGVPKNILYLQQVFERYTLKQWSPTLL